MRGLFISNIKISTYETALMLDEMLTLLGDVAVTCKYLTSAGDYTEKDSPLNLIAYATYAAYDKLDTYRGEFMKTCGFTDPLRNCKNERLSVSFNALRGGGSDG